MISGPPVIIWPETQHDEFTTISLVQVAVNIVQSILARSVTILTPTSLAAKLGRCRPTTGRPIKSTSPANDFLTNGRFCSLRSRSTHGNQQVADGTHLLAVELHLAHISIYGLECTLSLALFQRDDCWPRRRRLRTRYLPTATSRNTLLEQVVTSQLVAS